MAKKQQEAGQLLGSTPSHAKAHLKSLASWQSAEVSLLPTQCTSATTIENVECPHLAFQVFVMELAFNLPLAAISLHLIVVLAARAGFAAVFSWHATGKMVHPGAVVTADQD